MGYNISLQRAVIPLRGLPAKPQGQVHFQPNVCDSSGSHGEMQGWGMK